MTLDDLMAVWKSQDAKPLHGVNDTLLRVALRQDTAKLEAQRRMVRWVVYLTAAGVVAFYAVLAVLNFERMSRSGWVLPYLGIIGGVFVVLALLTFLRHQAQTRREQGYGATLRDQLGRHIAQLDFQLKSGRRVMRIAAAVAALCIFGGLALIYLNGKWDAAWASGVVGGYALTFVAAATVLAISGQMVRTRERRELLPHRQRLEALLRELDGQ